MRTKRKMSARLLASALALVMTLGVLPAASAANVGGRYAPAAAADADPLDNLVLNKTAQLEDDGTYTIKLEAYATGEVSTTTIKQVVPTDVILVLDQSGSMDDAMDGIPSDTYSAANPTNAQVAEGTYYVKVGDSYYRVTATKELVGSTLRWIGDDGKEYTENQLSYSWQRKHDGQTYNTARPFVTSSLSTWTRDHFIRYYYINDKDGSESKATHGWSAAAAREYFNDYYTTGSYKGYTVEFHNDGAPGAGDTDKDDPFYCAAVYIAVTQQELNEYRYTYSYVDDSGKTVILGSSSSGTEAEVDGAACAVNPLYTRGTKSGTRLDGLKYAAGHFIDEVRKNAEANGVDHRVAVIGFASSGTSYNDLQFENTELFVGASQYRYGATGNSAPSAHYTEALQSANTDTGYANLMASLNALEAYGGTYPQYGFEMANGVFEQNTATYTKPDGTTGARGRVVIFMTDGEPGSGDNVDATEANATIAKANTSKTTYQAKVFSVSIVDVAGNSDQANFLKNVSSDGTFTSATDAEALQNFLHTVSEEISSSTTTVALSKDSYLLDQLSDYFELPADFSIANNVTIETAVHTGGGSFANPASAPAGVAATLTQDPAGNVNGIYVSGFNFVDAANVVTTSVSAGGSTIANGNKLVVTIKGVLAKDAAATAVYVDTNTTTSGIYDKDAEGNYGMVKAFPMPHTLLDKKLFVLDYAKQAALDVYNATKVDSAKDGVFSQVDESSTSLSSGAVDYGAVSAAGSLTYTPNTMSWNGYDTFYALGKDGTKGDSRTQNIWSKVSVIPANNVYYEDSFIQGENGVNVGIKYDGNWTTEGMEAGNKETPDTPVHGGWQNSGLADDSGFSDGSAHVSTAQDATATFTFTGTGVDIYSYTDMKTGLVRGQLFAGTDGNAVLTKSFVVDNQAASGSYYQIPTLSFTHLDYGTYTVKLTVRNSASASATYYLDGIRVYNPLSEEQEADPTVSEAYGDEAGAVFTEVRSLLLDAKTLTASDTAANGVVFIDKDGNNAVGTSTSVIGVYEEYGPKHEVYLAQGQSIAFSVNMSDGDKLCVGLKAPDGETTVAFTNSDAQTGLRIAPFHRSVL